MVERCERVRLERIMHRFRERTPTASELSERWVLEDGMPATLRHIRPDDAAELERCYARLSPRSRYQRFFGGARKLSSDAVRYFTCVDGDRHVAIVAVDDAETGLGVVRFVCDSEDRTIAEIALTVMDEVQGKGLGRHLAIVAVRAAKDRGVRRFRGEFLFDNEPVRRLVARVGGAMSRTASTIAFEIDLDRITETMGQRSR